MKRHAAIIGALGLVVSLGGGSAQAAAPLIPTRLYPPGTHVMFRPALTNAAMDCAWGFVCEGRVPLFHRANQDDLRRIDGWAAYGTMPRGAHRIVFQLFASHYASTTWAAAALNDLRASLADHGYTRLHGTSVSPLVIGDSNMAVRLQRSGTEDLVVIGMQRGRGEVEAIVMFRHGSPPDRAVAVSDLANQVRYAIGRM